VRVAAAGVGPWDAWVRERKSALEQPLPLTPGSDISGTVVAMGPEAAGFHIGQQVFGVTNASFTGGYAEYAIASAAMMAEKPSVLSHAEAASLPVVASTARQMVFDHARVELGERVLVLGGGGNVGGFAVRMARLAGASVVATARAADTMLVSALGAEEVIEPGEGWTCQFRAVDAMIDTVGGKLLAQAMTRVRPGGVVVSAVEEPDPKLAALLGVTASFMLVSITTAGLTLVAELAQAGRLMVRVGEILPLNEVQVAHERLAGRTNQDGKIVLRPGE